MYASLLTVTSETKSASRGKRYSGTRKEKKGRDRKEEAQAQAQAQAHTEKRRYREEKQIQTPPACSFEEAPNPQPHGNRQLTAAKAGAAGGQLLHEGSARVAVHADARTLRLLAIQHGVEPRCAHHHHGHPLDTPAAVRRLNCTTHTQRCAELILKGQARHRAPAGPTGIADGMAPACAARLTRNLQFRIS
jgi:hypothetical protein